jgi:hypothetical protein
MDMDMETDRDIDRDRETVNEVTTFPLIISQTIAKFCIKIFLGQIGTPKKLLTGPQLKSTTYFHKNF